MPTLRVRPPEPVHERLLQRVRRTGEPVNRFISDAIREKLDREEGQECPSCGTEGILPRDEQHAVRGAVTVATYVRECRGCGHAWSVQVETYAQRTKVTDVHGTSRGTGDE